MGPPPAPQLLLLLLFPLCLPRALWGDVVFLPPFIRMSDTSVTAALVGDTEDVNVSLTVWDGELGILPVPDCGLQNNGTSNWSLTVTPDVMGSEVTIRLNGDLQACVSELDFFSDSPCVVETLLVSASRNSSCLAHLLIQVEIYPNASFAQNVSQNSDIFINQMYRPFGSCPCNLVAGACDVRCCCDKECTPDLIDLFKEYCFTGVFGGEVNPPFDHLCSNPVTEEVSDWFPFLCVHSSLENTPFLGYFFHGLINSHRDAYSFTLPISIKMQDWSDFGYMQNSPLMTVEKDLFTIPQTSIVGQCIKEAPVAFLQNFDVNCVTDLAVLQEWEDISKVRIKSGVIRGFIVPQVIYEESTALDRFIYDTEIFLPPGPSFKYVKVEEHYIFKWKETRLIELNVKVIWAKIHADQQGILMQRFKVTFLSFNTTDAPKRSGNPGYYFGHPVRALNIGSDNNITTLNLWRPVGRGLCTGIETIPVLFGEDAVSGCFLELGIDENCTQLRAEVTNRLNSLVQATHVAKKGNSDYYNLLDGWLEIIRRDVPFSGDDLHLKDIRGLCHDVPAVMNIRFLISDGGNLEGIPQNMILGAEVSFSSVTWQFPCGMNCEDKPSLFPISVSVQFVTIPPQLPEPLTSFQISYSSHDCTNNEVCWPELIFPLSRNYQGESYDSSIAKSLMLAFIITVIILFNNIWIKMVSIWDLFPL